MLIRDRLCEWLGDEQFAAAFGTRGKPGWSPSRLALVPVGHLDAICEQVRRPTRVSNQTPHPG